MHITIDERKGEVVVSGEGSATVEFIPKKWYQFWRRKIKLRGERDELSIFATDKKQFKFGGGKFGGGGASGSW